MGDTKWRAIPAVAAMLAAGCGIGEKSGDADAVQVLEIDSIVLEMKAGVNDDWPARVSLVRVDDVGLMNNLLHMDTRAWFGEGGRRHFATRIPRHSTTTGKSCRDRASDRFDAWIDEDVVGVMFCGTRGNPPPLRLTTNGDIRIEIGHEGCAVAAPPDG